MHALHLTRNSARARMRTTAILREATIDPRAGPSRRARSLSPVIVLAVSAFLAGATIPSSWLWLRLQSIELQARALRTRNALLETMVVQLQARAGTQHATTGAPHASAAGLAAEPPQPTSLPARPVLPQTASAASRPTADAQRITALERALAAERSKALVAQEQARAMAAQRARQANQRVAAVRAQPHPASPPAPVSARAPRIAKAEAKPTVVPAPKPAALAAVAADQVGIVSLGDGMVTLKTGQTVRVGQDFPNGERLVSVNPEQGEVVTNRRTLLLFFAKPGE